MSKHFSAGRGLFLILAVFLVFSQTKVFAQASDPALLKRLEQMEARINELEARLAVYENREQGRQEKLDMVDEKIDGLAGRIQEPPSAATPRMIEGFAIGAGATGVYQFTDKANSDDLSQNSEDVGDASYSVDLEIAKEFSDHQRALILFEAGEGAGVEDELKVFSNVNFDATGGDSNVGIVEGWYEQEFGPATVRAGKLDATYLIDANAYANDEASQFLGRMFRNNPAIEFSDNGGGLRLAWAATEWADVESVIMDGNADWDDLFDGPFYAGQVNIKPDFFDRPGNYRLLGWGSSRQHTQWDDVAKSKELTYGFGLSFDQEISDHWGVFARYGWQNPEVYLNGEDFSLEQAYSVGLQCTGGLWHRDDDVFAVAFGGIIPSDDYKRSDSTLKAHTEYHWEAYYNYKINDHLSISPDVQVILNPFGGDAANGDETVVVTGIRSQVDF